MSSNVTQIKVFAKKDQYNLQAEVFKAMANENISVDFINISPNQVVYTVTEEMTDRAISILEDLGMNQSIERIVRKYLLLVQVLLVFQVLLPKLLLHYQKKEFEFYNRLIVIRRFGCLVKRRRFSISAVNALHDAF